MPDYEIEPDLRVIGDFVCDVVVNPEWLQTPLPAPNPDGVAVRSVGTREVVPDADAPTRNG